MGLIYFFGVIYILIFGLMYYSYIKPTIDLKNKSDHKISLVFLFAFALLIRIIIALNIPGFKADFNCFSAWSDLAYSKGLRNFYSGDFFADYPPGYIYVLYLIGFINHFTNISANQGIYIFILKFVPILCDLLTALFIYRLISKKINPQTAMPLSFLYLFNPAILVNASAWGQVDSVFTLFVILSIYYAIQKKLIPAGLLFTIGMLIKPQTAIFAPVMLFMFYEALFKSEDKKKALVDFVKMAGLCIIAAFIIALPYTKNLNFYPVIDQYIKTMFSKLYPYASVNAYNLFALFGGNFKNLDSRFLFLTYGIWGNIFIIAIVAFSVYLYFKKKANFFLIAAFIISAMFTLSAKMHERYIFPVFALILCAFAYSRDKRFNLAFLLFSCAQFFNTATVLLQDYIANYQSGATELQAAYIPNGTIIFGTILSIIAFAYFLNICLNNRNITTKSRERIIKEPNIKDNILEKSDKNIKMLKADYIIMAAVTLIYSVVAFINLGDRVAPETYYNFKNNHGFSITFNKSVYVDKMQYFLGPTHDVKVDITCYDSEGAILSQEGHELGYVYTWNTIDIYEEVKKLDIICTSSSAWFNEIAFRDQNGELISPQSVTSDNNFTLTELTDEQYSVPVKKTYKNSAYFDEIYHARTAYEFIHGIYPYENTHPPLGKIFISLGILAFGMNPFGWRFSGTLIGILMLPVIYLFVKRLFKRTDIAAFAIILFAVDFMHFAQTRIATIDVYVTFFIILMYYYMYKYISLSFYDTPLKKTFIPLGLSGMFMGLGIASKWTGIYAGMGLAVIFFVTIFKRYFEYKKVTGNRNSSKEDFNAVAGFKKYTIVTILWCIPFFIIIPAIIYGLSYIPFVRAFPDGGIKTIIDNQINMLSYHAFIKDTHPYSSLWWQWPIMTKPIWYYSETISDTVKAGISSFGNPAVWWGGIIAFFATVYFSIINKDKKGYFLIIAYLAQYLPWVGVSRVLFIYHYFTCVPFVILMVCYVLYYISKLYPLKEKSIKNFRINTYIYLYISLAVILFIMFYPVLSGTPVSTDYVSDYLRWFNSWVLI